MTPTNITFSPSYEDYLKEAESYILTLREPIAKKISRIVRSMRIFTEKVYGYLPTAGEMKWPVLEPNYIVDVTRLVPFHEAYSYGITNAVIYFYVDDSLFLRVFTNPDGLGPHYHNWKNGRPFGDPKAITSNTQYQQLLNETISYL